MTIKSTKKPTYAIFCTVWVHPQKVELGFVQRSHRKPPPRQVQSNILEAPSLKKKRKYKTWFRNREGCCNRTSVVSKGKHKISLASHFQNWGRIFIYYNIGANVSATRVWRRESKSISSSPEIISHNLTFYRQFWLWVVDWSHQCCINYFFSDELLWNFDI